MVGYVNKHVKSGAIVKLFKTKKNRFHVCWHGGSMVYHKEFIVVGGQNNENQIELVLMVGLI